MPFKQTVLTLALVISGSVAALASEARYRLEVDITWSQQIHPHDGPAQGGHMSGLIGMTHTHRYVLFADGRTASSGLELVAESGRTAVLRAELDEVRRRQRIDAVFDAPGLATVPGRFTTEFTVKQPQKLVSFVTMLAPSPDWFAGLSSIDLSDGEAGWRDKAEFTLWVWDAGTDNGEVYEAPNSDTQPRQSVRLLATPHVVQDSRLVPAGRAVFTKLD
jgi:hypothetical protein